MGFDNKNKLTKTALGHFPAQKAEKGIIMKTYYISVTETLNKIVEVQANDEYEAIHKVSDAYYNDEFELDHDDFVDTEFEDDTDRLLESYDNGGLPKYYEVK